MDMKQHALAAEVRAEMAAQQVTTKDMQRAVGVSSSAWSNYFVACARDVPLSVVVEVARALRMPPSELLRRAEARAAADPGRDDVEEGMSADTRRVLREQRERFGVPGDVADPSGRTRADVDEGRQHRSA